MTEGYRKTTGKNYEATETLQCRECFEIFERKTTGSGDSCPKCGKPAFPYQRTVSNIAEERDNEEKIGEAIAKLS